MNEAQTAPAPTSLQSNAKSVSKQKLICSKCHLGTHTAMALRKVYLTPQGQVEEMLRRQTGTPVRSGWHMQRQRADSECGRQEDYVEVGLVDVMG